MRLLVAYDHHFLRAPDGVVYVGHPMSLPGYIAWQPYLSVFDEVVVLGRVAPGVPRDHRSALRADGPGVRFCDVPDYLGPWEYARRFMPVRAAIRKGVEEADAYILKVPGVLSHTARRRIIELGRPYALEVIADPWDMYAPGAVRSPVRPLVRWRWTRTLRAMCREAGAVAYVTRQALQARYPPGAQTWSTFVSDVDLKSISLAGEEQIRSRVERWRGVSTGPGASKTLNVGFLGALAQLYKAQDVLIRAAAEALRGGITFNLRFAGDGKFRPELEALAESLGIRDRVQFLGALSAGGAVQDFLDETDLFVLPSRQEGLPRALVEAMARGCPAVGSTAGGIPELLDSENLVPPGDAHRLAAKICEVLADPQRLERMARRNLRVADEYRPEALNVRRTAFYRQVRDQAEDAGRLMIR